MRRIALAAIAATVSLMPPSLAHAQYPTKPVNIIVPFAAGTASDLATRIVANELATSLGQPVIVQNRPGANGAIGAAAVAAAAPDGYTLLLATAGTAALPAVVKNLSFDVRRDFTPISAMTRFLVYLYVNAELPIKTVPELLEHARANPGKLNFATGNPVGLVATAQLLSMAGNPHMVQVPYKGEPAAVTDLVANRVQVMFATPSSAESFAKTGKLRALATNLPQRSPFAPEVPSMNEFFPRFSVTAWAGLMGPRGLPREIVDRLSREVSGILGSADIKEKFNKLQYVAFSSTPDELNTFFNQQIDLYSTLLRAAGVQPE